MFFNIIKILDRARCFRRRSHFISIPIANLIPAAEALLEFEKWTDTNFDEILANLLIFGPCQKKIKEKSKIFETISLTLSELSIEF